MAVRPVVFNRFEGGWSTDLKVGIPHSAAYTQSIDFRKKPSQITVLPGLSREDGGVVQDLVQNCVMASDGSIYSVADSGNFYKRTTGGTWTLLGDIGTGTFGMDYRKDTDSVYICDSTTVALYGPVSGSASLTVSKYADSVATANTTLSGGLNINPNQSGSPNSYTVPVATTEDAFNKRYFQSDIEPTNKIAVFINAKGTGNWTLALHDGLNNVLGTATVTNANLTSGAFNGFTFSTPVRIYVSPNARTYHFHLTSTVADGTASAITAGRLDSADVQVSANRLIATTNGLHPMARFLQYECIGNGNYLSVWEPLSDPPLNSEWQRHRLSFPQEYEVCGLAVFNEFLAVALQRVSTSTTSDPQEGLIAWWDGLNTQDKPNYFTKIPEGTPQSLREYKNNVYYYAGGAWYRIASPAAQPEKIRTMPDSDTEYSGAAAPITVYPYAATVRRGVLLMAYPSTTTNTAINYGVYSWGAIDRNFPESFGFSYPISTGSLNYSVSNNLTIGMVKSFGDTLLVSWRDDSNAAGHYGVDVISNTSTPAVSSSWQSVIFDNGFTAKRKKGMFMQCTFLTLPSDCSFILKYKINRGSWISSSSFSTASADSRDFEGGNYARLDINSPSYFREIQLGIDITAGTTTPTFTSLSLLYDDTREEGPV